MATSTSTLHAAPAAGFDAPFEMLGACHERVRRSLALLRRLAAHLRTEGADASARSAAGDVLRYFDQAAPAHHEDEERHVLPLLLAAGDPALAGLAGRLRADHECMAQAWARARPGLAALAAGEAWPGAAAAAGAHFELWDAFAALYDSHLEAEDGVAFPAAAALMGAAARQAMGEEMAGRRGVFTLPPANTTAAGPT